MHTRLARKRMQQSLAETAEQPSIPCVIQVEHLRQFLNRDGIERLVQLQPGLANARDRSFPLLLGRILTFGRCLTRLSCIGGFSGLCCPYSFSTQPWRHILAASIPSS